ncbi:3-dehydroquinate synthase II [Corynebacterium sp. KPL4035]
MNDKLESSLFERLSRSAYTGVVLSLSQFQETNQFMPATLKRVVRISSNELASTEEFIDIIQSTNDNVCVVIASSDMDVLETARCHSLETCLESRITNAETLEQAISDGRRHNFLLLHFADPTNIPMELVLAELQDSETVVLKSIEENDVEGAMVSLGVMESGSDGVLFTPSRQDIADQFLQGLSEAKMQALDIQPARIIRTSSVQMGHRSCIDAVTLFTEQEGIVVGSTSQGGFLCCSEVFDLPYMDKRPFRVNAGGVHSYVYLSNGRTRYMSELRAGDEVSIVSTDGTARNATVGRVKTEVRPLRLLEAEFDTGERINVVLQDDWHVRVFGTDGTPINITELRTGDEVLAHLTTPGRHVGIPIRETIKEN